MTYAGPSAPPRETPYVIERDAKGWAVFAVQRGLNTLGSKLVVDGDFGPITERAVKDYQSNERLTSDGKVGPVTQRAMVKDIDAKVSWLYTGVPKGLLRGFAEAEGGNLLAAVNWSQPGGVDCGVMQIRVYGSPYDQRELRYAFAPGAAFARTANRVLERYDRYRRMEYAAKRSREFSLRCASLGHNWPYAAEQYARNGGLPNPNRTATWVPAGVKFPDGASVVTWRDWAEFYAMGGLHGEGRVTKYVTGW